MDRSNTLSDLSDVLRMIPLRYVSSSLSNDEILPQVDTLSQVSPATITEFGLFSAILMLGTVSSLAPLPGNSGGGFWPIYVKEHYSLKTSQNLLDPYSFSHVNHGVLGFLLANLLGADLGVSFVLTIASALLWEILENTKFVIDLFRENSGPSEYYRGIARSMWLVMCYDAPWDMHWHSPCQGGVVSCLL